MQWYVESGINASMSRERERGKEGRNVGKSEWGEWREEGGRECLWRGAHVLLLQSVSEI